MMTRWTGDIRLWRWAAAAMAVLALGTALALTVGLWRHSSASDAFHRPKNVLAPSSAKLGEKAGSGEGGASASLAGLEAWDLFQSGGAAPKPTLGGIASRYRLAGVFTTFSGDDKRDDEQTRCAILDDVQNGEQLLAAESEWAGDVRVMRVEPEYVLLSDGTHEEMVFLAPPALGGNAQGGERSSSDAPQLASAPPTILETNRFGARIGDTRWEIKRDAIMKYAKEVMDDPQRVSGMYLGMEPDYGEDHAVEGYKLNTSCGEADFYEAVGLRHGDVVRRVNSIRMTSQRRAEFLMSQFFDGQLDTFVFDIEREGQPLKLIYLVR